MFETKKSCSKLHQESAKGTSRIMQNETSGIKIVRNFHSKDHIEAATNEPQTGELSLSKSTLVTRRSCRNRMEDPMISNHENFASKQSKNTNSKLQIAQVDDDDNVLAIFESLSAANRALGVPIASISRVVRGNQNDTKGFRFRKALPGEDVTPVSTKSLVLALSEAEMGGMKPKISDSFDDTESSCETLLRTCLLIENITTSPTQSFVDVRNPTQASSILPVPATGDKEKEAISRNITEDADFKSNISPGELQTKVPEILPAESNFSIIDFQDNFDVAMDESECDDEVLTQEQRPQASNYFERPYLGNENQKGSVEPKPAVAEASHKEDYSSGVTKSVGPSSFTDERLMAKLDNALREVLIFDATHAIIPH